VSQVSAEGIPAEGGDVESSARRRRGAPKPARRQKKTPAPARPLRARLVPQSVSLTEIEPVSRESTAAIIARRLREAITNGALPPGAQLGESELAAQFQVSRGPLREAMQRLVSEGLLRSERHRGLFVIDLEPEDVHDIYTARLAIERSAVLCVLRDDREAVADRLAEVVQEMTSADEAEVTQADIRFHEVLVAASGSKRLQRMASGLLIETRMCLSALGRTYVDAEERVTEHKRITEAIRAGDADSALSLLEAHMEDAVQRLAPGLSLYSPPTSAAH
jgi:DNA-binding GntR family transcriptional regulator